MDVIERDERYNPSGKVVGPRRQATCECCRRNDAPQGERLCESCASHQRGAVEAIERIAAIDPQAYSMTPPLARLQNAVAIAAAARARYGGSS